MKTRSRQDQVHRALSDFLDSTRVELIARCRSRLKGREKPDGEEDELDLGITTFLDQVIRTLRAEQSSEPTGGDRISGPADGCPAESEMARTAGLHGQALLKNGFTADQVVHEYGDLCQAITGLAHERGVLIQTDEFKTLNRCLDNAIAVSITEFEYQRDRALAAELVQQQTAKLGFLADELRDYVSSAMLAVSVIKTGKIGWSGPTGRVLDGSLVGLRNLIDRTLTEVHMDAGVPIELSVFPLAAFITKIKVLATVEADYWDRRLIVTPVDPHLAMAGDCNLLLAALGNLLQNAFKFSCTHGEVILSAYANGQRIFIDVQDRCGGLPPHKAESLFESFTGSGGSTSGIGLGLAVSRRAIKANLGELRVRNLPGTGCVFTIDLPRHDEQALSAPDVQATNPENPL